MTSIVSENVGFASQKRLSPTTFLKEFANASSGIQSSNSASPSVEPSLRGAMETPKSHHRAVSKINVGADPNSNKKKASSAQGANCESNQSANKTPNVVGKSRTVSMTTCKPALTAAAVNLSFMEQGKVEGGKNGSKTREKCQSAPLSTLDSGGCFKSNVYFTPPPPRYLRRQQSASATMSLGSGGRYAAANMGSGHRSFSNRFTPPIGEDISAVFAGSKFSDSPSAKSLPLPPNQWLEEARVAAAARRSPKVSNPPPNSLKYVTEEDLTAATDDDSSSSTTSSSDNHAAVVFQLDGDDKAADDRISSSSTGSLYEPLKKQQHHVVEGTRFDPLALIAAVAAS